ncbi:hypothetical protein FA15DRAFT_693841 [Coprinopsis marcescibilis]|uniref:RRM domain-containing protein n=1 Tax=Coprinopsis marcescibilis TaxID=230819 RepID=A0A5C3KYK0_COPMA|nr:hypothetical protein FA15DRAFT_693841 [Coprinopsis marcescibilis]
MSNWVLGLPNCVVGYVRRWIGTWKRWAGWEWACAAVSAGGVPVGQCELLLGQNVGSDRGWTSDWAGDSRRARSYSTLVSEPRRPPPPTSHPDIYPLSFPFLPPLNEHPAPFLFAGNPVWDGRNVVSPGRCDAMLSVPVEATLSFNAERGDGNGGVVVDLEDVLIDRGSADNLSGSSDDVEIYLNDMGLDTSSGLANCDERAVDESPLLPGGPRFSSGPTVNQRYTHIPLLSTAPNPESESSHSDPKASAETIQEPTATSTPPRSIARNLAEPRTSTPRSLLSPVPDFDSPQIPPATRMATVPLPDMDDDPTLSIPTSMEQLDFGQEHQLPSHGGYPRKSPLEKPRLRPLSLTPGPLVVPAMATPPPSSPLPSVPGGRPGGNYPSTAPAHTTYFGAEMLGSCYNDSIPPSSNATAFNAKPLSFPNHPSMQPSSSYTQTQPLPQLPTFAPALSAISERSVSKDDLDVSFDSDRRSLGDDNFSSNRADQRDMQSGQRQQGEVQPIGVHPHLGNNSASTGVTLIPNHQQYGTITVSNSVISFPNSSSQPPTPLSAGSVMPSVTSPLAQDESGKTSSSSSSSGRGVDSQNGKTPNVYINGLPPHFPEDQLYALCAPFGEVKSVRTFTRHVRDSESGYGFVLFETVDAAERCIGVLRKYRNLHPTFSKQVHKIPGTVYAQASVHQGSGQSDSSDGYRGWDGSEDDQDASFKARMEALADPLSTNLYMEGLPLSIDEPTLGNLVAPHRIISSRFFQTRLSNPPRIIAFVRLDTRAGAEEIVERLHGRMVRGWNDAGSRISVRFADTSEQRELRRQERASKEGGGASMGDSPARLTIAQAALLNLRGHDLQSGPSLPPPPPPSAGPAKAQVSGYPVIGQRGLDWPGREEGVDGREVIGAGRGLALGVAATSRTQLGNGAPGLEYSAFANGPGAVGPNSAAHHRNYQLLDGTNDVTAGVVGGNPFRVEYGRSGSGIDPAMQSLLESLNMTESMSVPVEQREVYRQQLEQQLLQEYQGQEYGGGEMLQYGYGGSGVASTHTGYTPAEEYIMRSHLERQLQLQLQYGGMSVEERAAVILQQQAQRKRPTPLDLGQRRKEGVDGGGRGYGRGQMSDEEAFHAQAPGSAYGAGSVMSDQQQQQQNRMSGQYQAGVEEGHQVHMRANTIPYHRASVSGVAGAGQMIAQGQGQGQTQGARHYSRNSVGRMALSGQGDGGGDGGVRRRESVGGVGEGNGYRTSMYQNQSQNQGQGQGQGQREGYEESGRSSSDVSPGLAYSSHSPSMISPALTTYSGNSPSMISPALTYSSQTQTPSTLSPATPFFGTFGSGEGFKGGQGGVQSGGEGVGVGGGEGAHGKSGMGGKGGVKSAGIR